MGGGVAMGGGWFARCGGAGTGDEGTERVDCVNCTRESTCDEGVVDFPYGDERLLVCNRLGKGAFLISL